MNAAGLRNFVEDSIVSDTQLLNENAQVTSYDNVTMPKEMRDLLRVFPQLTKQTEWWRYNADVGDFVQVSKKRTTKRSAFLFLDCVMNPRELCSRETLIALAPLILFHMRLPTTALKSHAHAYVVQIVERAYDM
jgi:hypothetical protein